MRVEIRSVNEKNQVIMWNRETDEIFKKEVSEEIAELYRKELARVRVIETVLYEEEKEKLGDKEIPDNEQIDFKLSSKKD